MFKTELETSNDEYGVRLMAPLVFESKSGQLYRVESGSRTKHPMGGEYAPAKVLKEHYPQVYREALKSLGAPFWAL